MYPQQQPSRMPFHRYQPFKPIDLPDTPPVALSGAEGSSDDEGPAAQAE